MVEEELIEVDAVLDDVQDADLEKYLVADTDKSLEDKIASLSPEQKKRLMEQASKMVKEVARMKQLAKEKARIAKVKKLKARKKNKIARKSRKAHRR